MARKRPFRVHDILAAKSIEGVTASPDGQLVVVVVARPDEKANKVFRELWAWSVDRGVWQVTFDGQAVRPQISPKGDRLAFLSDRAGEKKQLFVMTIGLSEGRKVTDFEEGVEDFRWAPDGRRLAVLAKVNKTDQEKARDQEKRDWWTADADERRRRLWVVRADGPGQAQQVSADDEHVVNLAWTSDSRRLAYCSCPLATTDSQWTQSVLKVVGADGRGRKYLCPVIGPILGYIVDGGMSVSPDGRRLLICETFDGLDLFHGVARTVDLRTGRKQPVARGFDRGIGAARWLSNDEVCLSAGELTSVGLYVCKLGSRPVPLATGPGVVSSFDVAPKAGRVFYDYTEFRKAEELHCLPLRGGGMPQVLTRLNRAVEGIEVAQAEVIRWKAPDGLEIEGILYLPAGRSPRKPCPLVLMPHGGPYGASTNGYPQGVLPNVLCSAGYAVLLPNFRGSTGYGRLFTRRIIGNWGDGPMKDILAGVDALVRRGVADRRRLAIVGGSYGGFLTTYTIGHTNRFRCAVAIAPVTSNVSMFGTTDIPSFMLHAAGGAAPGFAHRFWRDQSPTHYAARVRTPTLIVTGDADERVPPGQSREFYRLLRRHGVETKLVLYPREPHGFGEPRHRLNHVSEILQWIQSHQGR